jgi:hypothetical protein
MTLTDVFFRYFLLYVDCGGCGKTTNTALHSATQYSAPAQRATFAPDLIARPRLA